MADDGLLPNQRPQSWRETFWNLYNLLSKACEYEVFTIGFYDVQKHANKTVMLWETKYLLLWKITYRNGNR